MDEKEYAQTLDALLAVTQRQWQLVNDFEKRLATLYDNRYMLREISVLLRKFREFSSPELRLQVLDACKQFRAAVLSKFQMLLFETTAEIKRETQLAAEETKTLMNLKRNLLLNISTLKSENLRTSAFKFILDEIQARMGKEQEFEKLLEHIRQVIGLMGQYEESERDQVGVESALIGSIELGMTQSRISSTQIDGWIFSLEKSETDFESTLREERSRVILPLQRLLGEQLYAEQRAKKAVAQAMESSAPKIPKEVIARDVATFVDAAEFQRYHDVLLSRMNRHLLSEEAIRFLEHGERPSAVAGIRRFFSTEMFRNLALTDQLTRAYSRHFGDKELTNRINEARRYKIATSVLIFDIDKFKSFNDVYGHKVGDIVLAKSSELAKKALKRKEDSLVRWGGEEFVVILPGASKDAAVKIAESILNEIALQTVAVLRDINRTVSVVDEALRRHNVTISIGVATFPDDFQEAFKDQEYGGILLIADQRLNGAKRAGRNRVRWSDNPEEDIPGPDVSLLLNLSPPSV